MACFTQLVWMWPLRTAQQIQLFRQCQDAALCALPSMVAEPFLIYIYILKHEPRVIWVIGRAIACLRVQISQSRVDPLASSSPSPQLPGPSCTLCAHGLCINACVHASRWSGAAESKSASLELVVSECACSINGTRVRNHVMHPSIVPHLVISLVPHMILSAHCMYF